MPQNFFEPRTPVRRVPGRGLVPEPVREPEPVPAPEPAPVPDEPSWARIYWNTLRSFLRRRLGMAPRAPRARHDGDSTRHDGDGTRAKPARRPLLLAVAVLVAAVLALTAVLLTNRSGTGTGADADGVHRADRPGSLAGPAASGPSAPAQDAPSPQVRDETAAWVAAHVGPGQVVACDAAVCGALAALDFPASSTVLVQGSAQQVQSADVAVVTATLRSRLGAVLDEVTAAQPLATFGAGAQRVTVQTVAHAGRAAYARATTADLADRRAAGKALLANKRLTFAPGARTLLAAGRVDIRVCALLATLSGSHALTVTSFGTAAPGAGPGVPLSGLDLSTVDKTPATGAGAPAAAVRALIAAQQAPYRPLATATAPGAAGAPAVLTVLYAQPAPTGLVSNPTP